MYIYKKINLFIYEQSKLMLERERDRYTDRQTDGQKEDCNDWKYIFLTHVAIHIFRTLFLLLSLTGCWYMAGCQPRPLPGWYPKWCVLSTRLTVLSNWPLGSKNFCHYIIFWRSHVFSLPVNHFRCLLFTLRYSCISCLRNPYYPSVNMKQNNSLCDGCFNL